MAGRMAGATGVVDRVKAASEAGSGTVFTFGGGGVAMRFGAGGSTGAGGGANLSTTVRCFGIVAFTTNDVTPADTMQKLVATKMSSGFMSENRPSLRRLHGKQPCGARQYQ